MSGKRKKLIISIDGGGIRGVLSIVVLRHIEKLFKKYKISDNLGSRIDCIAGTSTGAIISAGLTIKKGDEFLYSPDNLLTLYRLRGPKLFTNSHSIDKNHQGLSTLLKRKFKDLKLADLNVKYVFISFDVTNNSPFIFSDEVSELDEVPLHLALSACSAIPGMFPSVSLQGHELIDGFVVAKNPAWTAYQHASKSFPKDDLLLVSIGTGLLKGEMFDEIEENAFRVDEALKKEEKSNPNLFYYRFQPELITADQKMDEVSLKNINALITDGKEYVKKNELMFERLIKTILQG